MLQDQLLVDHFGNGCRQAVQHEARRIGLVDGEGVRVGCLGLLGHIVAGQAELGENEGRALVEFDDTLKGPRNVFSRDRVAGRELQAGLQLERIGQMIVGYRPAFGKATLDLGRIVDIETDEQAIGIAGDFGSRQS
jgi:hypothetical protein